jgi:hypothetical protein
MIIVSLFLKTPFVEPSKSTYAKNIFRSLNLLEKLKKII